MSYYHFRGKNRTIACYLGENLKDPNRADRLLRRFSWQEPSEETLEALKAKLIMERK